MCVCLCVCDFLTSSNTLLSLSPFVTHFMLGIPYQYSTTQPLGFRTRCTSVWKVSIGSNQ